MNAFVIPDYLVPSSVSGLALRALLQEGSADGVMDLLKSMNARGVAQVLSEAGFHVEPALIGQGRAAVFASVQADVSEALDLKVDGFGLDGHRAAALTAKTAKKEAEIEVLAIKAPFAAKVSLVDTKLNFEPHEFDGNVDAAQVIQSVMRSSAVAIGLLGGAETAKRSSLVLIAGQALQKNIQGFGFDGIEGKFEVPLSMAELVNLHRGAAAAVAVESARRGLGAWSAGEKVATLNEWVPDSVQRLLYGSVTLESAKMVMQSIQSGSVERHASEIGADRFTKLLASQGLDIDAVPIENQIQKLGLTLKVPDNSRIINYSGRVVALDHRAVLIKTSRLDAVELPFVNLAAGQKRPTLGDSVHMTFKYGEVVAHVLDRVGREAGR